jgi:hypothetical protein
MMRRILVIALTSLAISGAAVAQHPGSPWTTGAGAQNPSEQKKRAQCNALKGAEKTQCLSVLKGRSKQQGAAPGASKPAR